MKLELSTLENLLIRHALGCYAGKPGYRKNKNLKNDMRDIQQKLAAADTGWNFNFSVPDGKMIGGTK